MREDLVNAIYAALNNLAGKEINGGYHHLANEVPDTFVQQGLYFFFDPAIQRVHGGEKIIRIGKTGDNGNNRLGLHKNGNVSNSVFRKHVARALGVLNGNEATRAEINAYVHPLPYLFLPVHVAEHLQTLEKRCIEIISNSNQAIPIDVPTTDWLGYQEGPQINAAIAYSHLWNVHHVKNFEPENVVVYDNALNSLQGYIDILP
ncbi:MAG: hypothetical protein BGO69_16520 [Bacteroidetes bacterium 46-16]|nr:MAG: hypothetical protein BGO69_16520 [Bacteroidetes bacterium 46-16]